MAFSSSTQSSGGSPPFDWPSDMLPRDTANRMPGEISAITSDGELFGWGLDSDFDLSTVPESLDGKNVIAAASGEFNSMALTDDGKITPLTIPGGPS